MKNHEQRWMMVMLLRAQPTEMPGTHFKE